MGDTQILWDILHDLHCKRNLFYFHSIFQKLSIFWFKACFSQFLHFLLHPSTTSLISCKSNFIYFFSMTLTLKNERHSKSLCTWDAAIFFSNIHNSYVLEICSIYCGLRQNMAKCFNSSSFLYNFFFNFLLAFWFWIKFSIFDRIFFSVVAYIRKNHIKVMNVYEWYDINLYRGCVCGWVWTRIFVSVCLWVFWMMRFFVLQFNVFVQMELLNVLCLWQLNKIWIFCVVTRLEIWNFISS